jgi:cytochrome b561
MKQTYKEAIESVRNQIGEMLYYVCLTEMALFGYIRQIVIDLFGYKEVPMPSALVPFLSK